MSALYLIRHSLTEGNERRLYYGATDLPLTEAGRALCRSLRGSYDLPDGVAFATSGMRRAEETLELLFGDVPHERFPDLREAEMGIFEMKSYDELKDTPAYQQWLSDASGHFEIPGGESNQQVLTRVMRAIRALAPKGNRLIVCHGGVIACALNALFPEGKPSFWDWVPGACHGYAVEFEPDTDAPRAFWEI